MKTLALLVAALTMGSLGCGKKDAQPTKDPTVAEAPTETTIDASVQRAAKAELSKSIVFFVDHPEAEGPAAAIVFRDGSAEPELKMQKHGSDGDAFLAVWREIRAKDSLPLEAGWLGTKGERMHGVQLVPKGDSDYRFALREAFRWKGYSTRDAEIYPILRLDKKPLSARSTPAAGMLRLYAPTDITLISRHDRSPSELANELSGGEPFSKAMAKHLGSVVKTETVNGDIHMHYAPAGLAEDPSWVATITKRLEEAGYNVTEDEAYR